MDPPDLSGACVMAAVTSRTGDVDARTDVLHVHYLSEAGTHGSAGPHDSPPVAGVPRECPMPFLVPLTMAGATLIGGAGAAVATVASSRSQSGANRRATATQARGTADTLAFEREREATRRAEYDREQAESRTRWEAEERGRAGAFVASEEERPVRRGRG